jgi:tetratricopeptide (TPR) repeat protein/membrane protein implicated in regulation of membrane protease activity
MDLLSITFLILILLTGILSRRPFLHFPLDDDFSIYTYRARFASKGFQWKKDLQIIGIPIWRMLLMDKLYGNPEGGVARIRHLQTFFHVGGSTAVFFAVLLITADPWSALAGGLLHAFYGTSPDLTAGSFNHEQFYIPFTLLGFSLLTAGPEFIIYAGLCFGLATLPKFTTGLYPAVLSLAVGYQYGLEAMTLFILATSAPIILSNLIEYKMGFWDSLSRKQMQTRMATTLRLSQTKAMYFNRLKEVRHLIGQTLPLWLFGLPGLTLSFSGDYGIWVAAFTVVTLAMIVCQRAFSRYHYLPWFAWLTLGCGLSIDFVLQQTATVQIVSLLVFLACTIWNIKNLLPFYSHPTDRKTLAQYEKFDQYIYLPHLGKVLKRLTRMRGERDGRIFVWGTFSQLYHLTDLPAADNYLHHSIGPWDTEALEGFHDGVIGGLIRHKPAYLIKTFADLDVDYLEQMTGLRYTLIKVVLARFPVYRLTGFSSVANDPLALSWQEKMHRMQALTQADWHAPAIDRTDFEQGRTLTALRECLKLVQLNPGDSRGLIYLGEIYSHLGQPKESAQAFERALGEEPLHSPVRLLLARQKINLGLLNQAEDLIFAEIVRFGKNDETLFLHALIHQKQNRHQQAVNEFERFRTLYPERHDCWQALMGSLKILNDREQLQRLYAEAETIASLPDREWIKTSVASAIAQIDKILRPESETIDYYLKRDPENSLLIYARASALEREGEMENAFGLFKQLTTCPDTYPHIQARAWFRRARLSRGENKLHCAQKCLALDPGHQGAINLLAQINSKTQIHLTP